MEAKGREKRRAKGMQTFNISVLQCRKRAGKRITDVLDRLIPSIIQMFGAGHQGEDAKRR